MLASLYMNTYNRQDNPVGKQNIFRAKYWSQQQSATTDDGTCQILLAQIYCHCCN